MFDPFGDFASRGYLRNHAAQSDLEKVKQLEHSAFRGNVARAMDALASRDHLEYADLQQVHSILFSEIYPWAGEDRRVNAPDLEITKAGINGMFSHPFDIELAANHALDRGQNAAVMRDRPGEIMGYLAHAHPFLDGNGRAIMTVHAELCRRAGIHIDWSQTEKSAYLSALTNELQSPGKGHLDSYLSPFVRDGALDRSANVMRLQTIAGLGPETMTTPASNILIPAREIDATVTRAEINAAAANNRCYERVKTSLHNVAQQVFADSAKILAATEQAAFTGRIGTNSVAEALATDPSQFGEFRGKDGRFSGRKERQEHRNAVAMQYALKSQLREYVALIHSIREQISHDKHDLARRGLQAVPLPSESLSEAIRLGKPLTDQQASELKAAVKAFDQRFGDDAGHLRTLVKLKPGLAEKHGVDQSTLQEARNTVRKLDKGVAQLREQERAQLNQKAPDRNGPIR